MKFRIVQQRGVFRILKCERVVSFDKPFRFKHWAHNGDIHLKWGGWKSVWVLKEIKTGWPKEWTYAQFDTYKKAENYIRKFYGSTGVDAIEKPKWGNA